MALKDTVIIDYFCKGIFKIRLEEMKEDLLARGYSKKIIFDGARIPFVITYPPGLPSISTILRQCWKVMTKDENLKKVFPKPPMVAYSQPKNSSLRQLLDKYKLPEREKRVVKGLILARL